MTDQQLAARRGRPRGGIGRTYLVECFASTAHEVELAGRQARALGAAPSGVDDRIEYVAALALPDDEQVFLVVRGPDAGSVRVACLAAGLAVERVAEVTVRRGEWPSSRNRSGDRAGPRAAGCRR